MRPLLPNYTGCAPHQTSLNLSQCSTSYSTSVPRRTSTAAAGDRSGATGVRAQTAASRSVTPILAQAVAPGRRAKSKQPRQWTYKYKHQPCPSPCSTDDMLCQEVEALVQNVLSFPNLPARIHRNLPTLTADINSMTGLVERMARHFGKELTLCYICKQPKLLNLDFDTLIARCNSIRDLLGLRDSDMPQILRKCPHLVVLDTQQAKAAFDNIPRVVKFTPMQVRFLVTKFPVVITMAPQYFTATVERLRQLCYTREEWARDFETMSPSLLAYFLRDATDQLMRLEYLASTGERPEWQLRDVMKPANRSFSSKVRNFAQWQIRVKQRRAQAKAAAQAASQQAVQQAEAAAIKAELLAAEDTAAQRQEQQQQSRVGEENQQQQAQQQS